MQIGGVIMRCSRPLATTTAGSAWDGLNSFGPCERTLPALGPGADFKWTRSKNIFTLPIRNPSSW